MNKIDFKRLNEKYPCRNWAEIARRIEAGEPVASSLKEAIQRQINETRESNDIN